MNRHVIKTKNEVNNLFLRMHPLTRFFVSLFISLIAFILLCRFSLLLRVLASWSIFSVIFLLFSWIVIFTRSVNQIKVRAAQDDGSTFFVFFMVIVSSFVGLLTVLLLMTSTSADIRQSTLFVPLSIFGILLAWTMVHTIYVFHYAHEYYDADDGKGNRIFGGLEFPNEKNPDYLDFAYFSFVMGCTFQVSDVEISSRRIRHIALVHGILSFVLNTFVVALTVNMIAGLV
ncbi:MAG: DUF1345 domain-containing protein [Paludibacteraceae bacterium]